MPRVRTFIAIDPGPKIRGRLLDLQEDLRDAGARAKWVERENLHVTLLFLGEVDMLMVPKVCAAVSAAAGRQGAFEMTVETTGCFPNPRRPRVLWAGVTDGREVVTALHDDMEGPLLDLGCYRREERTYTPHVTLGRVQGERSKAPDLSNVLAEFADWTGGTTPVHEVHVLSSELTPKGPIYTVLGRAKLAQ